MKKALFTVFIATFLLVGCATLSEQGDEMTNEADIVFETNKGTIEISLIEDSHTADNFRQYVEEGFYDGTVIHRIVMEGIQVVQGGGFTQDMEQKETRDPIEFEDTGLKNVEGSLSMARTMDPDSATSQFFINVEDNAALDPEMQPPGYAVFGHVVSGMDVVREISEIDTERRGNHMDYPVEEVVVEEAYIKE